MVTFVLVKLDMHPWSHSCVNYINASYVICGNTWALVDYFGIAVIWRLTSCVDFNTFPFGSWTWRVIIVFFLFINGIFGITKCLVAPVSTIALYQDGGDWIGCCKISLVFILYSVLNNIYAPTCHYITKVLSSWGFSNVAVIFWPMEG